MFALSIVMGIGNHFHWTQYAVFSKYAREPKNCLWTVFGPKTKVVEQDVLYNFGKQIKKKGECKIQERATGVGLIGPVR